MIRPNWYKPLRLSCKHSPKRKAFPTAKSPSCLIYHSINLWYRNYRRPGNGCISVLDSSSALSATKHSIGFAQIGDFKGLESDVVVLVDLPAPGASGDFRSLHYVGMSRAKAVLSLIFGVAHSGPSSYVGNSQMLSVSVLLLRLTNAGHVPVEGLLMNRQNAVETVQIRASSFFFMSLNSSSDKSPFECRLAIFSSCSTGSISSGVAWPAVPGAGRFWIHSDAKFAITLACDFSRLSTIHHAAAYIYSIFCQST